MENVIEVLAHAINSANATEVPLAAIYLTSPVFTAKSLTKRITEGDFVYIEGDELKDCINDKKANYVITSCHGRLNNTGFYIVCMHTKTLQLKRVNL